MKEEKRGKFPTDQEIGDGAYIGVKTGLAAVSAGIGGEIFSMIFRAPLEARREKWFRSLDRDLLSLEGEVDDLPRREDFISIALHASQIALRTHQEEKLQFLRNAIKNTARETSPTEDLSMIYLNILDDMTLSHLNILLQFDLGPVSYKPKRVPAAEEKEEGEDEDDEYPYSTRVKPVFATLAVDPYIMTPKAFKKWQKGSGASFVKEADMFTQVAQKIGADGQIEFCRQILKDLLNRGLLEEKDDLMFVSSKETGNLALSEFGSSFLKFIKE